MVIFFVPDSAIAIHPPFCFGLSVGLFLTRKWKTLGKRSLRCSLAPMAGFTLRSNKAFKGAAVVQSTASP